MKIGGVQKFSLIEYPGKVSAVIFTIGCNFRCPYCHNPELVNPELKPPIEYSENEILDFLEKRKGKLDAVVITGGEPLIHNDIQNFISKIKDKGYSVKIETNGSNPELLEDIIARNLLDYTSMDVKAPIEKYEMVCGVKVDTQRIRQSIELIMNSHIPYEFRTTYVKQFLNAQDIVSIAKLIKGAEKFIIQKMHTQKVLNEDIIVPCTYNQEELNSLKTQVSPYVKQCIIM